MARLIDLDELLLRIDLHGTNKFGMLDEDIREFLKAQPTVEAVVLPCKLGAPVFVIGGKYRHGRFEKWINPSKFRLSDLEKLGKTVFLTHKEAEEALAKMEE